MELFILFVGIIFSFATSLGVGSSTIAIINFFVAISDGTIEATERRMMGITYTVLRVAMVLLFLALSIITGYVAYHTGAAAFTPLLFAQWTVLAVLYLNAILMTLRLMPSTFGPGIQAGSWYTLGTLAALAAASVYPQSYSMFAIGYIALVILAITIVNGIMALLKSHKD
jgi:hypothetical protein